MSFLAEQRAVKAIAKDRIEDQESFSNEITILRTLVNLIKFFLFSLILGPSEYFEAF